MKKILFSLAAIGGVSAMVIAATGAFFSTSVTSQNNTFQTASMTMSLDHTGYPVEHRILDGRGMYPGSFVQSAVTITNSGSVAFNPDLTLANGSGSTNFLWLEVWTNGKLWYSNWLNQFPGYAAGRVTLDKVPAGQSLNVAFRLIMDESADNSVQGANYHVDLVVNGRQFNDPAFQPTSATADAGYVVNTWSYAVCGVRQPGIGFALKGGETYVGRGYDPVAYSPFYSYVVNQPMADNNDLWAVQTLPSFSHPGFNTSADGVCTLRDSAPNATGANLTAYTAPTTCTVTVPVGGSIQAALTAATSGSTVCVASGTHSTGDTYPLTINTTLTLAGLGSAGSAVLNGGC